MKQFIDKIGAKQNLTFSESKEASLLSEKVKFCFAPILSMNCFICF